jgi:leader peptidase (prepilin peptidase)/N-methyltransferase
VVVGVFAFALGCAVGSFLNVIIYRLPRGLAINEPRRSFCPHCKAPIRGSDNIPLFSFLMLAGRCRSCSARISWRYPMVEGLTGLLFLAVFVVERSSAAVGPGVAILMALLAALLVASSAIDIEYFIIPDEISIFGLVGGLLAGLLLPELHVGDQPYHTFKALTGLRHLDGLLGSVIGALGGGVLVLVFALIGALIFRREAIGIGDAKLMAMVGAFFGWKVAFVAFFVSPFVGLVYGLPLLIMSGRHVMPYGPFLSTGTIVTVLFRPALCAGLQYYMDTAGKLLGLGG